MLANARELSYAGEKELQEEVDPQKEQKWRSQVICAQHYNLVATLSEVQKFIHQG